MGGQFHSPVWRFNMSKRVVRLVKNRSTLYVPSIEDYELLKELGVPLLTLQEVELPLLKSRCKAKKVALKIKPFEAFEKLALGKVKERWDFPIYSTGSSLYFDIPKQNKIYPKAKNLVRALTGFYNRHLFDTDVKVRKFSKKVRFTIETSFNNERAPEWKDPING